LTGGIPPFKNEVVMPNQRKKGKKKAQFWITEQQQKELLLLSKKLGITKTQILTRVIDDAIELKKKQNPKP
jgi:hypothetical protein